ncbi:hypothetical protein HZA76_02440 [Candidatus Roizmanbacteria bacterium]|nr:hypothetical protein [Candidatus Roizmanbacteria bacterium]
MIGGEGAPVPVKPTPIKKSGGEAIPLTSDQAVKVVDSIEKKGVTPFTPQELDQLVKSLPPETPMSEVLEILKKTRKKNKA